MKIYVSLKQADVGEAELLAHCREQLTGYKVPSFVELRDELPKTAVGKLLRRQLRDEARAAMVQ